jgi:hypothetical protein
MKKKMIMTFIMALMSLMNVSAYTYEENITLHRLGETKIIGFGDWEIYLESTNYSWEKELNIDGWLSLRIEDSKSGNDEYKLYITASRNTGLTRTANFTVWHSAGSSCVYYNYHIIQHPGYSTLECDNTSFSMYGGANVLTARTTYNSDLKWRVVSSDPWIKITGSSSGQGWDGSEVDFIVLPSEDGKKRTGSIMLEGFRDWNSSWLILETISITQDGWLSYTGEKTNVSSPVTIKYPKGDLSEFWVDEKPVVISSDAGTYVWQPLTKGNHEVKCINGASEWSAILTVTDLQTFEDPKPNPPMPKDSNISITPTTRDFAVVGGGGAIITSGSGTWTASVSDSWITLNAMSGSVGYPVAYTVSANTSVGTRVGYVYVSGYAHTVTQEGVGADVDKTNITVERRGGSGTVNITAQNRMVWQAKSNVDWISVSPTSGSGEGIVNYQVAPFNELSTRQGTMSIAGKTVTVFQYGRQMKLESYSETRDWHAHVIPITVNALAITEWDVTPNASWISVVDSGNGKGGDLVSVAISENPSYKARSGTVLIGTERFTITQEGRTDLTFSVSPAQSAASVEGANGLISVTATPDLPWTATSGANWVTVVASTASGAGNGNIAYSASPNSTLYYRTGSVIVTPEAASGMIAQTHTVTQPAAVSALSMSGYEFEAAGESCSVEVSVADIVEWNVVESLDWITVNGSTARIGPGTVTLQAVANDTIYPRSGTVTIARKTFKVTQKARGVEVEYDELNIYTSDILLLCTDGLTNFVDVATIQNTVKNTPLDQIADKLVRLANDSGGGDNITAVVIS